MLSPSPPSPPLPSHPHKVDRARRLEQAEPKVDAEQLGQLQTVTEPKLAQLGGLDCERDRRGREREGGEVKKVEMGV